MAKNKSGRPTVMTKDTIQKLEHAFSIGANDLQACFFANISKSTFYDYLKQNPQFSDRLEALKGHIGFVSKGIIAEKIKEGDTELAKWHLERREKDDYSTKQNTQLGSDPDNPLSVTVGFVNVTNTDT